ncbi:membrane-bound metallopeptidase [Gottschalkia purinilytica]|uniref:Membrane-bound metallopeptidase n=1 Tax=Gottschalkia purinilytica TaxID=1503 RepID=A0A0L0WE45_GOTPU|nr:copper amine oxidase N-terminal domain-containing protein [Gottschalkia purinilytica]KNF09752.1 membrane-bound metallopeptidase [Gottschalkia purinilytica]
MVFLKRAKKVASLLLVSTLVISSTVTGLAKKDEKYNVDKEIKSKVEKEVKEKEDKEIKDKNKEERKKAEKEEKEREKQAKEQEKKERKEKERLEKEKEKAEKEKEKAERKQKEKETKESEKELKEQIKKIKEELKNITKGKYSEDEIKKIQEISEKLKELHKNIKTLPVENVISKDKHIKFDTPPVIKDGRTLIPVRAITEGFGATVNWNKETKEVKITKNGNEIILKLGSDVAIVNGKEVKLDVPSNTYNNRTYVPLRFIAENLGLKVEWDKETETIEIEDKETEIEDDTTETEDDQTISE